jgi:urea transport system ATP-binding protein
MSTDVFLEVSGLWARYGATPILQGVDLAVNKGEVVSLIGRNGVGKTTTMRCLIGLLGAAAGQVQFLGREITRLPAEDRARLGMGYIPQGRHVFPRMTVQENLEVGRLIGGPSGKKLPELVFESFPRLKERRNQIAGTMSGGEQQQLAIGRALIGNPGLMLLDEPSEGIQPSIVQLICTALRSFCRELGTTILFVEQNLDTILALSDRGRLDDNKHDLAFFHPPGRNSAFVRLPENSSALTSVSANVETYFLQTTSCQNPRRSEGLLSKVVRLCFTWARLRSRDVPPRTSRPDSKQSLCRLPDQRSAT